MIGTFPWRRLRTSPWQPLQAAWLDTHITRGQSGDSPSRASGRNVTFTARQYVVNGERRSFALLRPIVDAGSQDRLRDVVLAAYREHEAAVEAASA